MTRRMTGRIAAIGASLMLTMSIFSEPPRGKLRMGNVVERVIDDETSLRFDPREVVNERTVLTLQMERGTEPRATRARIGLN